jgi:hypothetical protein
MRQVTLVRSVLGEADEGRDALMAAALDVQESALEAWERWAHSFPAGHRDADPVLQRWLPLIAWNLRNAAVDAETRLVFRQSQRGMWASNIRIFEVARPALDALAAAGVRFILLKGVALALTVYDVPGVRPMGDVDLLIEPAEAARARRILADLGWVPLRRTSERDLPLGHGIDLRRPPHGALDLHWYLLHECCWPGADHALWTRAHPIAAIGPTAFVLGPEDQLLHTCLHGLRWSPVHAGHWIADATRVIAHAGAGLDWTVVVREAGARRLGLQMLEALRVVAACGHAAVPDHALEALARQPVSWRDRWECALKGRPVVSAGGLFVIWAGWRRAVGAAKAAGLPAPRWVPYLAAAVGAESPAALVRRFARHAGRRAAAIGGRDRRRGTSSRPRLAGGEP